MRERISNKWNVFKENNPIAHVCALIIIINVIFIGMSALLISVLPENRGHSLGELIRLAFTLMVNPSGKYIYSEAPISLIITTIVVLLGMISLTGGTVGFISSIINGFLEKAANNKRNLKLSNHIVILNYNNRVPSIIYDYSFDDVENTYIVILTKEDKDYVLDEIDNLYDRMGDKKKFKNIIVREGNPMSKLDLDKINLKKAKTVMLMMSSEGQENRDALIGDKSFEVSKLFMFVTWYFSDIESKDVANIVVESNNANMVNMVKEYHMNNSYQDAIPVDYNEITGKMLAITAVMPALNSVMKQLFSFEGVEVYIKDKNAEESILEELKTSHSVMPLFDSGDKRIYIAEDESEFAVKSQPYKLNKKLPDEIIKPNIVFSKTDIIIVGINKKLPYILESLSCFKEEYNSEQLKVILAGSEDEAEILASYYADEKYQYILKPQESNYVIVKDIYNPMVELGQLASDKADSIIFLSDDTVSEERIDEKPLMYWSNLKKSFRENDSVDIIVEILDSQNQSIIEIRNKDQIIVSDDFLGHLYAQLGKNPRRLDVIKDMITSEGDSSSINADQKMQNEGDILCTMVSDLFDTEKYDLQFASKRELILWIYEATGHKAMPIGVVKDSMVCIFARTDGKNDGLDSTVLLGSKEGQVYPSQDDFIKLEDEDELVLLVM